MGKAGVTCLDCHDPHTGTLKLPQEDNTLCLRCHGTGEAVNGVKAPVIDMARHTPCPQSSMGARCVECHMPESLYMAPRSAQGSFLQFSRSPPERGAGHSECLYHVPPGKE